MYPSRLRQRLGWTISAEAAIYENAKVLIRADLAESCTSGFLHHFHRPEQQNAGALKFEIETDQGEQMDVYLRRCLSSCEAGYHTISGDPGRLSTRNWAFQEQYVAQRSLAFGTHEISWACPCTRDCECGTPIPRSHTDPVTSMEWTTIVRKFTARDLTKASDRLPAISRVVAKMMADSETQISYNAGLWSNKFISHLSWYEVFEKEKLAAAAYHTPSWSWASATGPIRFQIGSDSITDTSIHRETDMGFEVKEVVCKAATENPYGPVQKGAHLIVQGHLYVGMHVGEGNKQEIVLVHFKTIRNQTFRMPNIEAIPAALSFRGIPAEPNSPFWGFEILPSMVSHRTSENGTHAPHKIYVKGNYVLFVQSSVNRLTGLVLREQNLAASTFHKVGYISVHIQWNGWYHGDWIRRISKILRDRKEERLTVKII